VTATALPGTSALTAWQERGDVTTYDALWRAACWESAAITSGQAGNVGGAESALARATEILTEEAVSLPQSRSETAVTTNVIPIHRRRGQRREWLIPR
jgi:hypothetical protein